VWEWRGRGELYLPRPPPEKIVALKRTLPYPPDGLTRSCPGDASGRRPVYGGAPKSLTDPYWKDYLPFYVYFP
jgi:hypothetical protein